MTDHPDDLPDKLRDAYLDLPEDQPSVLDWPSRVRGTVLRRRRNRLALVGTGLAILVVPVAVVISLSGREGGGPVNLAQEPTPIPTPVQTFTILPLIPHPTPTESLPTPPVPTPKPTDTTSTGGSSATPSPTASPTPSYPSRAQVIHASITGPTTVVVGDEATYIASATGDAETPLLYHFCASGYPCTTEGHFCQGHPTPTSPPEPGRVSVSTSLTFSTVGRVALRVEARDRCQGYPGGEDAVLFVDVVAAPTPTPDGTTASPSAEPTRGPTASR
jgi:hypothetical protein